MSRATSHPASITGHAVVRLKNGHTYVGLVSYDGGFVTIDGRQRVTELVGGASLFTYRSSPRRTVPYSRVEEIVWDDDAVERA